MKKGKIILSTAAVLITAVSAFAFKTFKHSGAQVYGFNSSDQCTLSTCQTIANNGSQTGPCHTLAGSNLVATAGGGSHTYFKARTQNGTCTSPTVKWTKSH